MCIRDRRRAEAAAAAAGRDREFRVGCDVWLVLDEDRDRARAAGREVLAQFLAAPQLRPMTDFYGTDPEELEEVGARLRAGDAAGAARRISDATLDTFVAAGNAEDVVRGLRAVVEACPLYTSPSPRDGLPHRMPPSA